MVVGMLKTMESEGSGLEPAKEMSEDRFEYSLDQKGLTQLIRHAAAYLERWYDVRDLSVLERHDLRRIAESVMEQMKKDDVQKNAVLKMEKDLELDDNEANMETWGKGAYNYMVGKIGDPRTEVALRWLSELLGGVLGTMLSVSM